MQLRPDQRGLLLHPDQPVVAPWDCSWIKARAIISHSERKSLSSIETIGPDAHIDVLGPGMAFDIAQRLPSNPVKPDLNSGRR